MRWPTNPSRDRTGAGSRRHDSGSLWIDNGRLANLVADYKPREWAICDHQHRPDLSSTRPERGHKPEFFG